VTPFNSYFKSRPWLAWLLALALMLPGMLPYLQHYLATPPDAYPTGYLATDYPYYIGNARGHFEDGFSLTYGLRFSPNPDTPKIYFQPQTLLLGLILKAVGDRSSLAMMIFLLLGGILFSRVAIALYERFIGLHSRAHWVGLILFFWGGGLYVIAGLIRMAAGAPPTELFHFDPFDGWWFINLGRNLVIPHETYIHALFLGTIVAIFDKRWVLAAFLALLTGMSHPFSGVQLLLILCAWCFLEFVILRSKEPTWRWCLAILAILTLDLGYYLVFLPKMSLDAQAVQAQMHGAWNFPFVGQLLGYALVLTMVGATLLWYQSPKEIWSHPARRLLIVWFLVTLGLCNHEFFIAPRQPLHFTRGYDWIPLFILGSPALIAWLTWLLTPSRRLIGAIGVTALSCIFLLDNAAWLTIGWTSPYIGTRIYKSKSMAQVIDRLKEPDLEGCLVLNLTLGWEGYLIACETDQRVWASHPHITPFFVDRRQHLRDYYERGVFQGEWRHRRLIILFGPDDRTRFPPFLRNIGARDFFQNDQYTLFIAEPQS
jgi:hypothetical protein